MRRTAAALITSALVLAACGGSDSADPVDNESTEPTQVETPVTDPPATDPPPTDPPATEPPATDPPATDPPATDPAATDPPATDPPALEAIVPAELGAYDVGVTTVEILDESRNRPLTVEVWFPLADGTGGDPHRYTFITGDYYESPQAVSADAASIAPGGPFPLVVYSHGSGGTRYIHSDYTELIASHGHVVVAPDHTGNTAVETVLDTSDPTELIAVNRPLDVSAVITAMVNPELESTAGFVASVDPERIAVTGHSFGGYTSYAVITGFENELGSVPADDRVDAIIPIAPASSRISDEQLAGITTPSLIIVGTNDSTTPVDPNVTRPWDLSASAPHYRLELIDAEHNTFTDLCAYLDFFPQLETVNELVLETIELQAADSCSADAMDVERAHDLTNTFALSFLNSVFEGNDMISDAAFEIPSDVIYLAK